MVGAFNDIPFASCSVGMNTDDGGVAGRGKGIKNLLLQLALNARGPLAGGLANHRQNYFRMASRRPNFGEDQSGTCSRRAVGNRSVMASFEDCSDRHPTGQYRSASPGRKQQRLGRNTGRRVTHETDVGILVRCLSDRPERGVRSLQQSNIFFHRRLQQQRRWKACTEIAYA